MVEGIGVYGSFEKGLRSFSQLKAPSRCLVASSNGIFKQRLLSPQQSSTEPTCICQCVSEIAFAHTGAGEELCSGWLCWSSSELCCSAPRCPWGRAALLGSALTHRVGTLLWRLCPELTGFICPRAALRTQFRQPLYHQCQICPGILPH